MNTQIHKLAQETDVWCDQNHYGDEFYNLRWEEHFAELIVKECARIGELKEQGHSDYDPNMSVGWYMRQHFGMD